MANENGRVVQVMGPVVDVEFPPGALPELFTSLRLTNPVIPSAMPGGIDAPLVLMKREMSLRTIWPTMKMVALTVAALRATAPRVLARVETTL